MAGLSALMPPGPVYRPVRNRRRRHSRRPWYRHSHRPRRRTTTNAVRRRRRRRRFPGGFSLPRQFRHRLNQRRIQRFRRFGIVTHVITFPGGGERARTRANDDGRRVRRVRATRRGDDASHEGLRRRAEHFGDRRCACECASDVVQCVEVCQKSDTKASDWIGLTRVMLHYE